MNIYIVNNL